MDESDRWLKNLGHQSSVKDRWPHNGDKLSDPSKSSHSSRSGFRRESGSDSQDGSRQEQSYHHTKSKTGELYSSGVSTGSKVAVPAHMRTTQSTTRPKTTPCVQEIPQPTPINVTPTPPSGEQPSTTRPYVGKHSATQSQAYTSSGQRSVKEHVVIKSRPGHAEVSSSSTEVHFKASSLIGWVRVYKSAWERATWVGACNYIKFETGWNLPPVLKIVTYCTRFVFANVAKRACDQCSIFCMVQ